MFNTAHLVDPRFSHGISSGPASIGGRPNAFDSAEGVPHPVSSVHDQDWDGRHDRASSGPPTAASFDDGVLKIGDLVSLYMEESEMGSTNTPKSSGHPANFVHFEQQAASSTTASSSLYGHASSSAYGFFTADGIITDRCGIVENRDGEFDPPNFKVISAHLLRR